MIRTDDELVGGILECDLGEKKVEGQGYNKARREGSLDSPKVVKPFEHICMCKQLVLMEKRL